MEKHQSTDTQWLLKSTTVFTVGSSEETNQAFRHDPYLWFHSHSTRCTGLIYALVYLLSSEACNCFEAATKTEQEPSGVVRLRICEKSACILVGTISASCAESDKVHTVYAQASISGAMHVVISP
jgi:hypothetical protein